MSILMSASGGEDIESRGYEFAVVIECRLGGKHFRAVGLAVEIELIGGFAHDVVELAFSRTTLKNLSTRRH